MQGFILKIACFKKAMFVDAGKGIKVIIYLKGVSKFYNNINLFNKMK